MTATLRFYLPWDFPEKNKERLATVYLKNSSPLYRLDERTRLKLDDDGRLFFHCELGDFVPPNIEVGEVSLCTYDFEGRDNVKDGPYKDAQLGISGLKEGAYVHLRGPDKKSVVAFYWAMVAGRVAPVTAEQMLAEARKEVTPAEKSKKISKDNQLRVFWQFLLAKASKMVSFLKRRANSLFRRVSHSK